jgi:hypothetical protein
LRILFRTTRMPGGVEVFDGVSRLYAFDAARFGTGDRQTGTRNARVTKKCVAFRTLFHV